MSHQKNRMADKLTQVRIALEGARKPEPLQALSAYGYDESKLVEGLSHYQLAEQAYLNTLKEQSDVHATRRALKEALKRTHSLYMDHIGMARAALPDNPETLIKLSALGPRRRDRTGWLRQASDFYQQALADNALRPRLEAAGIDLVAGQAEIAEVMRLEVEIRLERAEAQRACRERDAAFATLSGWMRLFVAVARRALRATPNLRDQLGV